MHRLPHHEDPARSQRPVDAQCGGNTGVPARELTHHLPPLVASVVISMRAIAIANGAIPE